MVLEYTEGDKRWACVEMGINQSTLFRWERKWKASPVTAELGDPKRGIPASVGRR